MTTTSPDLISSFNMAFHASSCELYTFAGPLNFHTSFSTAENLTMELSVAILPDNTAKPPCS